MPELPEVETIARQLRKNILGKTIAKITVHDTKVVQKAVAKIKAQKINAIRRHGKYLFMELDKQHLLVHLRMTGYFEYSRHQHGNLKYLAAKLHFQDKSQLTFHEIRRFGEFKIVTPEQISSLLERLGPDPVDPSFTSTVFSSVLSAKKKANIKAALMDQSVIAGIGNIYAQEVLYKAGIDPKRSVKNLSKTELDNLYGHLQSTLKSAIKHCGTTVQNYLNMNGAGKFQKFLTVYEKEQCPKKHLIERIVVGGRGTYWCKRCQR